jgi:hypothetical protein
MLFPTAKDLKDLMNGQSDLNAFQTPKAFTSNTNLGIIDISGTALLKNYRYPRLVWPKSKELISMFRTL